MKILNPRLDLVNFISIKSIGVIHCRALYINIILPENYKKT